MQVLYWLLQRNARGHKWLFPIAAFFWVSKLAYSPVSLQCTSALSALLTFIHFSQHEGAHNCLFRRTGNHCKCDEGTESLYIISFAGVSVYVLQIANHHWFQWEAYESWQLRVRQWVLQAVVE